VRPASSPLAELYERHVGRMVGLARLLTGDPAAAEDIAHDAFIRAASKMGTLRDPERLDTYLQRTVVNLCHSRGRRRALETAWLRRARPADDVQPPATEIRDEVWRAVLALPDRQRAAVVLRFYEDQSEERVGRILNCSPKAVNALVDRAKQTLREVLAEEDER
jgi:RNA polymerase sigma factor (sigma-70 family)